MALKRNFCFSTLSKKEEEEEVYDLNRSVSSILLSCISFLGDKDKKEGNSVKYLETLYGCQFIIRCRERIILHAHTMVSRV